MANALEMELLRRIHDPNDAGMLQPQHSFGMLPKDQNSSSPIQGMLGKAAINVHAPSKYMSMADQLQPVLGAGLGLPEGMPQIQGQNQYGGMLKGILSGMDMPENQDQSFQPIKPIMVGGRDQPFILSSGRGY